MEAIYEQPLHVRYCDTDASGRLRLTTLLTFWQECGMAQMQEWGQGNGFTMDQGLLWIVTRQQLEIRQLPAMDRDTVLRTWVGDSRHGMFPRSYELSDKSGTLLARGAAQWTLLHADTRSMEMKPADYGVMLPSCVTGRELPRQKPLRGASPRQEGDFTVPYSCLDANGHMNNARYLDLALDVLPCRGMEVRGARLEYHREVLLDEVIRWGWTELPGAGEPGGEGKPAAGKPAGASAAGMEQPGAQAQPAAEGNSGGVPAAAPEGERTYAFECSVHGQPCFRAQLVFGK